MSEREDGRARAPEDNGRLATTGTSDGHDAGPLVPTANPVPGSGAAAPAIAGREAEGEAREAIRQNIPLPEDRYPPSHTALGLRGEPASSGSVPLLLQTIGDLERLTLEARQLSGSSNFADISVPKNTSKAHVLRWLRRFATLRLARHVPSALTIAKSGMAYGDARYLLEYPVNLSVTDGAGMPLPGYSPHGLRDSDGYPLFHAGTRPKKLVSIRSSGALYRIMMSRDLVARFKNFPDQQSIRTWMHMFTLSSESDAVAIIQQRVRTASAGDNHIVLLLKAYLAYFDSIAACAEGVTSQRRSVLAEDHVLNVTKQPTWVSTTSKSRKEIVNVLGGSPGYQEFWAHCCFDTPPVYATKVDEALEVATTPFSHYDIPLGHGMVCICDREAFSATGKPAFFGQPALILSYIEMYVQRYGLQEQSNEALQIAMHWPALCVAQAHLSLPCPMHTTDWLGGEVESSVLETAGSELLAYSPKTVLASSLAAASAFLSQAWDFLALISSDRETWRVTAATSRRAVQWLVARLTMPGAGWHLLLGRTLSLSPSFLYLTGLSDEAVSWNSVMRATAVARRPGPGHLRLLQAFRTEPSAMCMLPWEAPWQPQLSLEGNCLTAEASTIVRLTVLGVLDASGDVSAGPATRPILSTLARSGKRTISVDHASVIDRLRIISRQGIKILALARPSLAAEDAAGSDSEDDDESFESLLRGAPPLRAAVS